MWFLGLLGGCVGVCVGGCLNKKQRSNLVSKWTFVSFDCTVPIFFHCKMVFWGETIHSFLCVTVEVHLLTHACCICSGCQHTQRTDQDNSFLSQWLVEAINL